VPQRRRPFEAGAKSAKGHPPTPRRFPSTWDEALNSAVKRRAVRADADVVGAGTQDAASLLLSLPVIVSVAVPTLTGFVIDKSAVVSAYGEVNVKTDHQFFTSDSVAVRCTWRVGHNVVRPNRIGTFTIAGGGS
jgi:hypothetical protein